MLFDEKDFNVFESKESKNYFKEILQSYYSQNYRATIVLLYSFVIYDLFMKLQFMADEGDTKATKKLQEISTMITDDEKYSTVENSVIDFFNNNSALYFKKFEDDIIYLKNCRNKCAHLKIDETTLYIPSDYHCRMLICSMYDNVFSVKAPFIMDLFSVAQTEIEQLSNRYPFIPDEIEENTYLSIKNKYLSRMTATSMSKSFKTFAKLLLKINDEECINNLPGLYIFVYSIIRFAIDEGQTALFDEQDIISLILTIETKSLEENDRRRKALITLMLKFPIIMDRIKSNEQLFDYISKRVLYKSYGLKHYCLFFPRSNDTAYDYFLANINEYHSADTEELYDALKLCENFDIDVFYENMAKKIPIFNGFSEADNYMYSFKKNIDELSKEGIKSVMEIYSKNDQCTNRRRHSNDLKEISDYIDELDYEE